MLTEIIKNIFQKGGMMGTGTTEARFTKRPEVNKSSIFYFIGFILTHSIIILIFSLIYSSVLSIDDFNTIDPNPTFIDFLYFAMSTHTRIGYGDIIPKTHLAKKIVMIQQFVVIIELASQLTLLTSVMLNPLSRMMIRRDIPDMLANTRNYFPRFRNMMNQFGSFGRNRIRDVDSRGNTII